MLVSTRGRYALRVIIDLAENSTNGEYIPMKDVAARQDISLKYLTKIMPVLTGGKLVEGVHGKGGGYRLVKTPQECTVGEILRLTEGTLAPINCSELCSERCPKSEDCRTLSMWRELDNLIEGYLDGVTVADLMRQPPASIVDSSSS